MVLTYRNNLAKMVGVKVCVWYIAMTWEYLHNLHNLHRMQLAKQR